MCDNIFLEQDHLIQHHIAVHLYDCSECKGIFDDTSNYNEHVNKHTVKHTQSQEIASFKEEMKDAFVALGTLVSDYSKITNSL